MAGKVSIIGQISEIDREIAMRLKVYPHQVSAGKMKQAEADMLMDRAYAIRETLVFCREHKAEFLLWLAEKKAGGE